IAQALDQARFGVAEGTRRQRRDVAVPVAGAPAAVSAIGSELFAEVAGQVARLAAAVGGEFEDLLQPFQVALLALDEALRHRLKQMLAHRAREAAVADARSADVQLQVALFLQVVERGDDALARLLELRRRGGDVELVPDLLLPGPLE